VQYFYGVIPPARWLRPNLIERSEVLAERATVEQQKEEATVPRYYVQQSDGAPSWKTVATAPSRQGAQSLSRGLQKAGNGHDHGPSKRYVRAMSRDALVREGGVDSCICAEDDLEGLELERAVLRMRS
jgi:hypothetical protein